MGKIKFCFEDLEIWKKAVEFARMVISLSEKIDNAAKERE